MQFLFWNTNNRELEAAIGHLAASPGADVVALAENPATSATMLASLGAGWRVEPTPGSRVRLFTRLNGGDFRVVCVDKHYAICRVVAPVAGVVLLTAVHLPSKLRTSPSTQRHTASDLAQQIGRFERRHKTQSSLLIGDVNMNPFDPVMVEMEALHAVSSRSVVGRVGSRTMNLKSYPMFYSPMWSHMGDGWRRPPGTYYRRTTDVDCLYFHTIDQVLVRPALASFLTSHSVRVLTRNGLDRFASDDDIPLKSRVSDHLPLHVDIAI